MRLRPCVKTTLILLAILPALALAGCASAQPTFPPGTTSGTAPRAPGPIVGPSGPSAKDATRAAGQSCLHISRHQYEVCTAYVANASYLARLPFYKFGHLSDASLARAFKHRLESRYVGAARTELERQTAGWPPPGQLDVYLPSIHIDSVTVAPDLSTATLRTHETWLVRTERGATLFAERDAPHDVSLARVPGIVLHKWVVTAIR